MELKYYLKEKLPPELFNLFKEIYKQRGLFHYWIPYVFYNGRALPPTRLSLEITYRCNQRCLMCPQAAEIAHEDSQLIRKRQSFSELTTDEVFALMDEAARMGIKDFCITGGEPFMRKDIVQFIRRAKEKRLNCSVLSNGTLINQELAWEIVAAGLDRITFSLDGPREIHDKIRNVKNAFINLMQTVAYLKEAKQKNHTKSPYLSFSSTISAVNSGFLSQLLDVAVGAGLDMNFGYLFYTTAEMAEKTNAVVKMEDAKDEDQDVVDYLKKVDVKRLIAEIAEIKLRGKKSGIKTTFQPPLQDMEIHRRFYDDSFAYTSKCFYPWYGVRINPYGGVYPCSMGILMGNIRESNLDQIWNNERYVNFRRALKSNKLFPKCVKCCVLTNKLWSYLPAF